MTDEALRNTLTDALIAKISRLEAEMKSKDAGYGKCIEDLREATGRYEKYASQLQSSNELIESAWSLTPNDWFHAAQKWRDKR